jgi:cyanophycinase
MSSIIPKGKLIAIGGNVDKGTDLEASHTYSSVKFFEEGILHRILSELKGKDSRIEVITTASLIPEEIGQSYQESFALLGCSNVGVLDIRNREDVKNPEYLERIKSCDGIMITGGNQLRLSSIYGGTKMLEVVKDRYQNDASFMIAGTSAGAMAMSNTMIYGGESSEALLKGEVKMTTGLALISDVIIDTHFVSRGRFGRLAQTVAANPSCLGIGLGEDTGFLITNGNELETIGSGLVLLFDGTGIKYTNIGDLPEGMPISIENLNVHVLAKGCVYSIDTKKFTPAPEIIDETE